MAGAFGPEEGRIRESNVVHDLPAARQLFADWPTPLVASGWEIGNAVRHSDHSMKHDYAFASDHPLVSAYTLYRAPEGGLFQNLRKTVSAWRGRPTGQPTWDLTSVLYAVRPGRGYFDLSPPGRISVGPDGRTTFHPSRDGLHRHLILRPEQAARVREAQELLCSQPPVKRMR
jgi:hypothetical protein